MTGSLQVKNDKYYMVLGSKVNGKWKYKWTATGLTTKGNKRRAEKMLQELLNKTQEAIPASDMRFSDYIRQWLQEAKRRVDEVTFQGYELMAKAQVLPWFDACGVKLEEVTHELLQAFFDEKADSGRKDGKGGLSPSSLRQYKNIISQALDMAVKNRLISSNPCQFVELPKKQRHEAHFYTAQELKALFAAISGDPLCPLVQITAMYGLRRSEVLGLQWDAIDFESGTFTICHTVSRVTTVVEKDKTKNAASRRSFKMSSEARGIFQAAKAAEVENRRLCGRDYVESGYVFKWPDGTPFKPDYVSNHFKLLIKKHNLPPLTFHELRHSCASLLLSGGYTLKDVQEYLGHADIQMTANIYGHLDTARKQTLTDAMAGCLFDTNAAVH